MLCSIGCIWWPYSFLRNCPLVDPFVYPYSSHMAFLRNYTSGWPQLTHAWPFNPAIHYPLVWGPFYQIWLPQGISKEFYLWLTPADPCMTFDPSNELHFGQRFFLPNLVAIQHSKQFDLWLTLADPCMTFDPSNALRSGRAFFAPNLVATGHC